MRLFTSYKFLLIFLSLTLIGFRFFAEPVNILSWDVFGYYLYLPANFIYNDLSITNHEWLTDLMNQYEPSATLYQITKLENNKSVIQYTMGISILISPLFFLAHFVSESLGYPPDGLSLPYQYSSTIGGLIYAIIGLIFFAKTLHHYFNDFMVCLILVIVFFGTNYFQLTAFDGTLLSHNFLFTLYTIVVYYTIQWYSFQKIKYIVIIGLSIGFIILIRPSEIVCVLIPLMWDSKNSNRLSKIELIKTNYLQIIIALICSFMVVLPQLIYWKSVTGDYLFYSYTNPGEGLDFLSPHTFSFLFSFRKGWFVYTPVMIFSFLGFYYLFKKNRAIFYTLFFFIILDIYIISSWTTWWYAGGSYSSRSLVPAYVLLAIPLGYFVEKIKSLPTLYKYTFSLIFTLLIGLNLFQTWQFETKIIDRERMTVEYYFATFGKTTVSENDKKLLLVDRSVDQFETFLNSEEYTEKLIYHNSFEANNDTTIDGISVFEMSETSRFSSGVDIKFKDITHNDHAWLQVSALVFIPHDFKGESPLLVVSFHHKNKVYKYRTYPLDTIKTNDWNEIKINYLTPEVRSIDDNMKAYVWYRGMSKMYLSKIHITAFEKNKIAFL